MIIMMYELSSIYRRNLDGRDRGAYFRFRGLQLMRAGGVNKLKKNSLALAILGGSGAYACSPENFDRYVF